MTVQFVKYKLKDRKIPDCIEDGGYFPDGDYLYGISKDIKDLPEGITAMSDTDMKTHIESLPLTKPAGDEIALTTSEKTTFANYIVAEKDKIKDSIISINIKK